MTERILIELSVYSELFADSNTESIFLLSEEESKKIWRQYIDDKANSYFQLPDDNWIIRSKRVILGEWMEDFNSERVEEVQGLLNKSFKSNNEDIVWFCMRKNGIIETTWYDFKRLWIQFLYCEDDCPILINYKKNHSALLFRTIGDFIKVGECD